jgi:hypothetical protein
MPVRPATQSHADIPLPAELTSLCDSLTTQNWRDTDIPWLVELTADDWQKVGRAAYSAAKCDTNIAEEHIGTVLLALRSTRTKPRKPVAYVLAWFRYVNLQKHKTIQCVSLDDYDYAQNQESVL